MSYLKKLITKNYTLTEGDSVKFGGYEMLKKNNFYFFYKTREKFYEHSPYYDGSELTRVNFCKIRMKNNILEIETNTGNAFTNSTPLLIKDKEKETIVNIFTKIFKPDTLSWSEI